MEFANVNTVYKLYNLIINKNQEGGYLSSDEYNLLLPKIQDRWFNSKFDKYGSGTLSEDDIRTIKKTENIPNNSSGIAPIPTDYYHLDGITSRNYYTKRGITKSTLVPHDVLDTSEFNTRVGSDSLEPTKDYPISKLNASTIETLPSDIPMITLSYLRNPVAPVWGFTVTNGRKVYDSSTSTQFEIPQYAETQLVLMLLEENSVTIRDQEAVQYALQKEQVNGN